MRGCQYVVEFVTHGMLNLTVHIGLHRTTNANDIWTRLIKIGYKSHSPENAKTSAPI